MSIDHLIDIFKQALQSCNLEQLQQLYHADAELISSDNITFLRGDSSVTKYIKQLIDKPIHIIMQLEKTSRQYSDKFASVSLRLQIQTKDGFIYHMITSMILTRSGNDWQIIQQHVTNSR